MSLMRPGTLQYRCRRCVSVDNVTQVSNLLAALVVACAEDDPADLGPPEVALTNVHNCPDGGLGVADLIGGVFDRPHPEPR